MKRKKAMRMKELQILVDEHLPANERCHPAASSPRPTYRTPSDAEWDEIPWGDERRPLKPDDNAPE
jgi:hypothetical protein